LIRESRIPEAVAYHDAALFERGLDDLIDELGARCREQERFGLARHLAERIDQQLAKLLAERRAAGLAGEDERDRGLREIVVQQLDLRRLARPFDALEGDEQPSCY
jgi:hypothetical protein